MSNRKSSKKAVTFVDEVEDNEEESRQLKRQNTGGSETSNGSLKRNGSGSDSIDLPGSNTEENETYRGHDPKFVRREFLNLFTQKCYSEGVPEKVIKDIFSAGVF